MYEGDRLCLCDRGALIARSMERLCQESLPYLYLCRGDGPSYRVLCSARVHRQELLERAWVTLFAVADALGMRRVGRVVVDSAKLRANASSEMTMGEQEYAVV